MTFCRVPVDVILRVCRGTMAGFWVCSRLGRLDVEVACVRGLSGGGVSRGRFPCRGTCGFEPMVVERAAFRLAAAAGAGGGRRRSTDWFWAGVWIDDWFGRRWAIEVRAAFDRPTGLGRRSGPTMVAAQRRVAPYPVETLAEIRCPVVMFVGECLGHESVPNPR